MQGFQPSTYGDGFADVYDDWYGTITDAEATAAFVAARRADGPVLELGVGSGRLVPALVAAGCTVVGVDASTAMLDRCRERVGGRVPLVRADLASLPIRAGAGAGAALCAFNTLFNLPTPADQSALLERLRSSILPDGVIIIEAITGSNLAAGPPSSVGVSRMTTDSLVLSAAVLDADQQTIQGQHVEITAGGVTLRPWMLRWTTPNELDVMAEEVGLRLSERWGDWSGGPFDHDGEIHISVYRPVDG